MSKKRPVRRARRARPRVKRIPTPQHGGLMQGAPALQLILWHLTQMLSQYAGPGPGAGPFKVDPFCPFGSCANGGNVPVGGQHIPTPPHGGLLNISLILALLHHITNCPVCLEIILQHVGPGGLGVDPYCPGGKGC